MSVHTREYIQHSLWARIYASWIRAHKLLSAIRAAFTYEPFVSSKKSIATHHARQRSSILQHEIPHSQMLERPYEHSQTPIRPGIWGINSSRGNSIRYLLEVLQKQRWRQQLASQLSTMEDTGGGKVNSHFIY